MQPGTVVAGRYVIESFAGIGGMSSVFKARDGDGNPVALKIMQQQATHLDARFARETSLLHKLRHPAIVRYLDSGLTEDGKRFLVLEWLDGVDLYTRLQKERLSIRESLQIIERMASALGFAHAQGVVHRDVKPNNIFLPGGNPGLAKLLDFGIARLVDSADVLTRTGARFGTPAYMSPEQVRADSDLDARADVFSLGCVLFECLTGQPAFAAKDPMAVFGKILFADPPRASSVSPGVPERLDALLLRMLARNPADRPDSGEEVAVEIQRLREALSDTELHRQPDEPRQRDTLTDLEQRLVSVVVAAVAREPAAIPGGLGGDHGGAGQAGDHGGAWDARDPGAGDVPVGVSPGAVLASFTLDDSSTNLALPLPPPGGPDTLVDQMDTMAVPGGSGRRPSVGRSMVPSMVPSLVPHAERLDELRSQLDALGAQLVVLHDGSLVAVLENRGASMHRTAVDQAVDAARCALALREALRQAPVALATGRAVKGREGGFMGEVIDRAVQLLASARAAADRAGRARAGGRPAGGRTSAGDLAPICIDEVTAGLVGARFAVARDGNAGFWLEGEREDASMDRPPPAASPFVGRNGELAALMAILDECIEEHVARAVLVTGPAGFGKSRLCDELLLRVRERRHPIQVWTAHGDPMRAGSPLHLLSAAVRRAAGIVESEPLEIRLAKLRHRVARRVPPEDAARVSVFLGEMLKMPAAEDDDVQLRAARMDPKLMGDQVRRALADLLDAETRAGPLCLILEDLHWGDRATVEVLDLALRNLSDRPLLVLSLGRPDVHELFPHLWASHNVTEIRLNRLPRRAAERLVRAAAQADADGDADAAGERGAATGDGSRDASGAGGSSDDSARPRILDTVQVDAIVERGDGNPFYLEELVRRVVSGQATLPRTVMAMVHARLGALEPQARRLLRGASVFGKVFWRGGVVALTGDEMAVDGWLQALVDLDLIAPAPVSRFSREREYSFRQALMQEGAYGMLTEGDRRLGHRLAGDWLEQAGEDDAQVLAEHFDRGGSPARARPYYLRAAEDALGRSDFDAAMLMAERGVACGAQGPMLGALRRVQMEEQIWRGNAEDVARLGLEAMRLVPRDSGAWYDVAGELAMAWGKLGELDRVVDLALELRADDSSEDEPVERLIAIAKVSQALFAAGQNELADSLLDMVEDEARALRDIVPVLAANIHIGRAFRADAILGDPAAVLEDLARCAFCYEAVGDVRNACLHRSNVGYARLELGLYDEAEADLRAALEAAERMAIGLAANAARQNLGLLLARRGLIDEARELEAQACVWFEEQEDARMAAQSRLYLALILSLGGDADSARREAEETLAQLPGSTSLRPLGLAVLARAHLMNGQPGAALVAADEAMRLLEGAGAIESGEFLVRVICAEAFEASGNREAARAAIDRARTELIARADRISRADWRQSFLERIPHHARILDLAQRWGV